MNHKILRLPSLLAAFTFLMVFAPSSANAQGVRQGRVIVDLYYGFPNLFTAAIRTGVNQGFVPIELETNTLGPLGGRAEYLVTDRLGIGLDIFYAQSGVSFTANGPDLDGNEATYAYDVQVTRPRVLARMNYHFGSSETVDPYATLGIGWSGSRIAIQTDDPIFNQNDLNIPISVPVAFRLGFGTRFMLTDNIGLSAELGFGGPLLTGGLSLRL